MSVPSLRAQARTFTLVVGVSFVATTILVGALLIHGYAAAGVSSFMVLSTLGAIVIAIWLLAVAFAAHARVSQAISLVERANPVVMAASRGDLNQRVIRIGRQDELGQLLTGVNRVLDLTEEFAKDTGAAMKRAGAKQYFRYIPEEGLRGDFLTYAQLINKVLADMRAKDEETSRFEAEVRDMVEAVAHATEGIGRTAKGMAHRSENAGGRSVDVGEAAVVTNERARAVSAATDHLAASINQIAQQVGRSAHVAQQAVTDVASTAERMTGLADAVREIGNVVEMIAHIARQTNMLALNATIEAARAGEAGKGFAVVAGEVKDLANQTTQATDDITRQVQVIQAAAQEAAGSIEGAVETIRSIDEIAATIAAAVQEQESSTREIASHIHEVAIKAGEVSSSVSHLAQASAQSCGGTVRVLWSAKALTNVVTQLTHSVETYVGRMR